MRNYVGEGRGRTEQLSCLGFNNNDDSDDVVAGRFDFRAWVVGGVEAVRTGWLAVRAARRREVMRWERIVNG